MFIHISLRKHLSGIRERWYYGGVAKYCTKMTNYFHGFIRGDIVEILGVWSIFASKCQLICLKKSMSLNIIFQHIFFWLERCCKFATSSLFQNFLWPCKGWLWIGPSWWDGMKCIIWFACQCLHDHLGKSEIKTLWKWTFTR